MIHRFTNPALLELALTHRSFVEEHGGEDNERLEWLGDSVLQMCVSELLFVTFPDRSEGELSVFRKRLVNNEFLAKLAASKGFSKRVRLGSNERRRGEQHGRRLLAGTYEAVLGGIYLDGGLALAMIEVEADFRPHVHAVTKLSTPKHVKQVLQEWVHAHLGVHPEYRTVSGTGPDHGSLFKIEALVDGVVVGLGEGSSKREASAAAATGAVEGYGIRSEE